MPQGWLAAQLRHNAMRVQIAQEPAKIGIWWLYCITVVATVRARNVQITKAKALGTQQQSITDMVGLLLEEFANAGFLRRAERLQIALAVGSGRQRRAVPECANRCAMGITGTGRVGCRVPDRPVRIGGKANLAQLEGLASAV